MTCVIRQSQTHPCRIIGIDIPLRRETPTSVGGPGPRIQFDMLEDDTPSGVVYIDQPGSYCLADNVGGIPGAHGIVIASDHVTLDLNGFSVVGVAGSLSGVHVHERVTNVTVRNGTVRGWGKHGIDMELASESLVEHVRSTANGEDGARVGMSCACEHVRSWNNTGAGIVAGSGATVRLCQALGNAGVGIDVDATATVDQSMAANNAKDGIHLGAGSAARACVAHHNEGHGIDADELTRVEQCDSIRNSRDGIHLGGLALAEGNRSVTCGGDGVSVEGDGCTLRNNTVIECGIAGK